MVHLEDVLTLLTVNPAKVPKEAAKKMCVRCFPFYGILYHRWLRLMRRSRARLLISSKLTLNSGFVQEIKVWEMPASARYPDRVRYRLALADPNTGYAALLFDNHWPKGHHVHLGKAEAPYRFTSVQRLLRDFMRQVRMVEGKRI